MSKTIRPIEARIAEIDKKIEFHNSMLKTLQSRRKKVRFPKQEVKKQVKELLDILLSKGTTIDELFNELNEK